MSWAETLGQKLSSYAESEFDYKETRDVNEASNIGLDASGIYMEATIIYLEIKNIPYLLKEHGRRAVARAYTMVSTVLNAVTQETGGFVNSFSPSAFLIVYPGKEDHIEESVKGAMKIAYALSEAYKSQFSFIPGFEFAMGMDHGHIMGTKVQSDNGQEHLSWFGSCIYKATRICKECARPFYIGVAGSVYHNLSDEMRTSQRRILGIKKNVEIWTKVTFQYENVKKHLYQTNHKISLDEA